MNTEVVNILVLVLGGLFLVFFSRYIYLGVKLTRDRDYALKELIDIEHNDNRENMLSDFDSILHEELPIWNLYGFSLLKNPRDKTHRLLIEKLKNEYKIKECVVLLSEETANTINIRTIKYSNVNYTITDALANSINDRESDAPSIKQIPLRPITERTKMFAKRAIESLNDNSDVILIYAANFGMNLQKLAVNIEGRLIGHLPEKEIVALIKFEELTEEELIGLQSNYRVSELGFIAMRTSLARKEVRDKIIKDHISSEVVRVDT